MSLYTKKILYARAVGNKKSLVVRPIVCADGDQMAT